MTVTCASCTALATLDTQDGGSGGEASPDLLLTIGALTAVGSCPHFTEADKLSLCMFRAAVQNEDCLRKTLQWE